MEMVPYQPLMKKEKNIPLRPMAFLDYLHTLCWFNFYFGVIVFMFVSLLAYCLVI